MFSLIARSGTVKWVLDNVKSANCSVVRFKKHKEIPCAKPVSSEEKSTSSSEIYDALKDENLQKVIRNIDGSPDAENELDKAMGVEVFRIFTDKILSNISP